MEIRMLYFSFMCIVFAKSAHRTVFHSSYCLYFYIKLDISEINGLGRNGWHIIGKILSLFIADSLGLLKTNLTS